LLALRRRISGIFKTATTMKKILLACSALLLIAPGAFAQNQQSRSVRASQHEQAAAQNAQRKAGGTATISYAPANAENANTNASVPAVQTSSDIVVPDHAYQPAGTAGVGFFGNGTGGSTIGSTPANGGTGYNPAQPASTGANTNMQNAKSSRSSAK